MTTPDKLARIAPGDRRVIARWVCERAASIRPSMFCTPSEAEAIQGVLYGIAVDLADPLAEDTTTEHARATLLTLGVLTI